MALETTKKISLDIYNNTIITINARQYDTLTRYVEVTCTEFGKKITLNPDEVIAFVRCEKPDGHQVLNTTQITSDGTVIVELTQQMLAVAGKCKVDVLIVKLSSTIESIVTDANVMTYIGDSSLMLTNDGVLYAAGASNSTEVNPEDLELFFADGSAILTTMVFYINVLASIVDNSTIESSDEYEALSTTFTEVGNMLAIADSMLALKEKYEAAQSATAAAADANKAAERAEAVASECQEFLDIGVVLQSEKGVANGVATLNENGVVPESQLDLSGYVKKTGDTMTGDLTAPNFIANKSTTVGQAVFTYDDTLDAVVITFN